MRWSTLFEEHRGLSTSATEKVAVDAYSKLLPGALGPYRTILATTAPVTIDQSGIMNTISSDRSSLAPNRMQLQSDMVDDKRQTPSENTA